MTWERLPPPIPERKAAGPGVRRSGVHCACWNYSTKSYKNWQQPATSLSLLFWCTIFTRSRSMGNYDCW